MTDNDDMIMHLKAAIALGYTIATPGSHPAVRAAFPDLFADKDDEEAIDHYLDDDCTTDDYPMVSRGDEGFWVSCWVWASYPESDDEDDAESEEDNG